LETADYLVTETLKTRSAALAKAGGKNSEDLSRLAAIILDPRGKVESMLTLGDLAGGFKPQVNRTVIVDARLGGLSNDGLLDSSTHTPPTTIDAALDNTLWNEQRLEAVGRRMRVVAPDSEPLPGWVREAAWPTTIEGSGEAPFEWRIEKRDGALTQGDPARSRTSQTLQEHLGWAAEEARRIAHAVGLSDEQEHMLTLIAGLHDLGKDRDLWQTAMGAPSIGRPFAKTDGRRANGRALGGYRHEFGSLRDAEIRLEEIANPDLRDLARHLLVAHHGDARPTIAPIDPSDPPSAAESRSRDVALRFVRLQRQWGPWGLAWWESLLRAADWAASARLVPRRVKERKAEETH
jgi:CRISPR-associated endonuclease/helicase Cas3